MKYNLKLTRHWKIQNGIDIPEIHQRLQGILSDTKSKPVDIPKGLSVEEAIQRIEARKKRTFLPHQEKLKKEFQDDLKWLKIQLGEAEAMRLVKEDWLLIGQTLIFGAEEPAYEEVREAVQEAVERRKALKASG